MAYKQTTIAEPAPASVQADRKPAAIIAMLYDSEGSDRVIDLSAGLAEPLDESSLLWIDISNPDPAAVELAASALSLDPRLVRSLQSGAARLKVDNYGAYQHFSILPVGARTPADDDRTLAFVVGHNWLITSHSGEIAFLDAFRKQDKAETRTGSLSASGLAASLLDWNLETYFAEAGQIEDTLGELDERILTGRSSDQQLGRLLVVRRRIGSLRQQLIAQRSVYYGLMRPDIEAQDSGIQPEHYALLGNRVERALDELDHTRELVFTSLSVLDSRLGQMTNELVQTLTFYTVVIGIVAASAGLFGMNFKAGIFETGELGFYSVVGGVVLFCAAALLFFRIMRRR